MFWQICHLSPGRFVRGARIGFGWSAARSTSRAQRRPGVPTDITQELWQPADELLRQRLPARPLSVRLLGMGVSGLNEAALTQRLLFEQPKRKRQSHLDAAADQIRDRFGPSALRRAKAIRTERPND